MIDHLEAACRCSWDEECAQIALLKFASYYPTGYGMRARPKGPITCAYDRSKTFHKASALCKHLESGRSQARDDGDEAVDEFVAMLRRSRWIRTRRGSDLVLSFAETINRWEEVRDE